MGRDVSTASARRDGNDSAGASRSRDPNRRSPELGAAPLCLPYVPEPRCARTRGRVGEDCTGTGGTRRKSECRTPLDLASRTSPDRAVRSALRGESPPARGGLARRRGKSHRRRFDAHHFDVVDEVFRCIAREPLDVPCAEAGAERYVMSDNTPNYAGQFCFAGRSRHSRTNCANFPME